MGDSGDKLEKLSADEVIIRALSTPVAEHSGELAVTKTILVEDAAGNSRQMDFVGELPKTAAE
jgi:hypothetical protein